MICTTVWALKNHETFENNIPLLQLGDSLRNNKTNIQIHVIFLEGFNLIPKEYLKKLEQLGFVVVDFSFEYSRIVKKYKNINNFYNITQRNWFLRWIACYRFSENHGEQFWHIDSDFYFHVKMEEIILDSINKNFVLMGCPSFVTVSDNNWFSCYEKELNYFEKNILEYSEQAFSIRDQIRIYDKGLCNYSAYVNPFLHDQDFIEFLISSGKIIQDNSNRIFEGELFYYQNGLEITDWDDLQFKDQDPNRIVYESDGYLWYGKKKIAFTHFTNSFIRYINLYVLVKEKLFWMLPSSLQKKILEFRITDTHLEISIGDYLLKNKIINKMGLIYPRNKLVMYSLKQNPKTNQINLVDILNFIIKIKKY